MKSDLLLLASIMVYIQLAAQRGTTVKVCFDPCSVIWFFTHCEPKSRRCLYNICNFLKLFSTHIWRLKFKSLLFGINNWLFLNISVCSCVTNELRTKREIHFTQTLKDISEMEQIIQKIEVRNHNWPSNDSKVHVKKCYLICVLSRNMKAAAE